MAIYIIEHLEQELWPWCIIEYKHMFRLVGRDNIWFTNIKKKDKHKLKPYGKVYEISVADMGLENTCVLDPDATKTLNTEEAKKYSYFIFGGILGDYPPKQRTKTELTPKIKHAIVRNIGKEQLSTDNAVYAVHCIANGTPLKKIHFQEGIEIKTGKSDLVQLPYRYALVNGKPYVSRELIGYIRKKKSF